MPSRDRLVWPLIAATALAAMVAGHALELWLEKQRLLGDALAGYAHSAQTFAIEAAGVLFIALAVLVVRRLVLCATRANEQADCLLPALHGIAQSGLLRTSLGVVGIQFCSLIVAELAEQRWSGFSGNGLASIFGPGHSTAIAVHAIIGFIAAFSLYRVARYVCAQTRALMDAVVTFLRWARLRLPPATPTAIRCANAAVAGPKQPVIARGLANRPPPPAFAFAA